MKLGGLGTFCLLVLSCAETPATIETQTLVAHIKSERFDELRGDPDAIAPGFVAALRELTAEGADPRRIVRVANRFLDEYPFCPRDLEIDEEVITAVVDAHYQAQGELHLPQVSCATIQPDLSFAELVAILDTWTEPHEDGGRCARRVLETLARASKRGPDWEGDLSITGGIGWKDLFTSCAAAFGHHPEILLFAYRGADLLRVAGESRWMSWSEAADQARSDRWSRFIGYRLAWLASLSFVPEFIHVVRITEDLRGSKHATLNRLGAAFDAWTKAMSEFSYQEAIDPGEFENALKAVDRTAAGTPFPDVVRYSLCANHLESDRFREAEQVARSMRPKLSNPFFADQALVWIADRIVDDPEAAGRTVQEAIHIVREVLSSEPEPSVALVAHAFMVRIHTEAGRESEKVASLASALRLPATAGEYESVAGVASRSYAEWMHARHLESRKEWLQALQAWRSWNAYTSCGLHAQNNHERRNAGMARCLDGLGRASEAATHYWEAVTCQDSHDRESTRRLFEIHRGLGTIEKLKAELKAFAEKRGKLPEHLKWLATELGVSFK